MSPTWTKQVYRWGFASFLATGPIYAVLADVLLMRQPLPRAFP